MDDDEQMIKTAYEQHDPRTSDGLAWWQERIRADFEGIRETAAEMMLGIYDDNRTLADLDAEETKTLLVLIGNLLNVALFYIFAPRDHMRALLAEVTPTYSDTEKMEA